jgi:lipoprotein-anchoring transpeptidase ErfK/SrfK
MTLPVAQCVSIGCWTSEPRRSLARVAILAFAAMVTVPHEAAAQYSFFDDGYSRRKVRRAPVTYTQPSRPKRSERQIRREAPAQQPSTPDLVAAGHLTNAVIKEPQRRDPPLFAVVSIGDQLVTVYGANGPLTQSKVSTGTTENPTPTGVFAIIQKNRWHESNIYSGAAMPFMQRITWSGVAMHEGPLPGYPASHGCIRLPGEFAEKWYGMTKLGLRIVVSPNNIRPVTIAHRNLPQPRVWEVPVDISDASAPPIQTAELQATTKHTEPVALARSVTLLEPATYAIDQKRRLKVAVKQSERAEGEAEAAAKVATAAAERAAETVGVV